MIQLQDADLNAVIHVIQTALTPIFLLSAVAGLLSVFTTRLARISDQVNALSEVVATTNAEAARLTVRLKHLRRRSHMLDLAVVLGGIAGAGTCGTVLALFLGAIRAQATATILFVLFGLAILCTMGAISAFLAEMLLASRGIRAEVARQAEELE